MVGENFHDLVAFVAVAGEQSFTRAATKLGVSQSALSQTVRGLEERLGVRLLTRTTRRVAPTDAGERLLRTVGPRFEEINAELAALRELRDKPAGTVRITSTENAAEAVLWPALERLLPDYPDIKMEIIIDYGLTDVVAERVDAGVRFGEQVAKDMSPCALGRTYAWPSLDHRPISRSTRRRERRRILPPTIASIFACRAMAFTLGNSRRTGVT